MPCACDESPVDFDHNLPECRKKIEELKGLLREVLAHDDMVEDDDWYFAMGGGCTETLPGMGTLHDRIVAAVGEEGEK